MPAWLREGRKAGLISESSLEEGLQITQPVNGAVYFLDQSMPASHQGIGLQTAGTPAETLQVWVNGSPLESLQPDGSAILPLSRGEYRVEIRGNDGRHVWDRVQYSVR